MKRFNDACFLGHMFEICTVIELYVIKSAFTTYVYNFFLMEKQGFVFRFENIIVNLLKSLNYFYLLLDSCWTQSWWHLRRRLQNLGLDLNKVEKKKLAINQWHYINIILLSSQNFRFECFIRIIKIKYGNCLCCLPCRLIIIIFSPFSQEGWFFVWNTIYWNKWVNFQTV